MEKKSLLIAVLLLFVVILSSNFVFAEDSALPLVDSGEVSGGVDISSVNPFNSTSSELIYEIPEDDEFTRVPIDDKQLKSIIEFFENYKLQLDDSD